MGVANSGEGFLLGVFDILGGISEQQCFAFLSIAVFLESNTFVTSVVTFRKGSNFDVFNPDGGGFLATTGVEFIDHVFECCPHMMEVIFVRIEWIVFVISRGSSFFEPIVIKSSLV